jgi:hypothetical protein
MAPAPRTTTDHRAGPPACMPPLTLRRHPTVLAIARLDPGAAAPPWAAAGPVTAVVRTPDELSIVAADAAVPPDVRAERGWCAFVVTGTLDVTLVGVLAGLSTALAHAGVSLFAISTFETDWLLVRQADAERATSALRDAGYLVEPP